MRPSLTTIGFDADDTLWHNENLFVSSHREFCRLLSEYHDAATVERTLYETEMRNLELYGYGIKSFTLSSIETAIALTEGAIPAIEIRQLIESCQAMLRHPVELIPGVERVLAALRDQYRLVLITKGDLRDQQRKVAASGLAPYFAAVEVVAEKAEADYAAVLDRLQLAPAHFLMVGNSLKSDIRPVLALGGYAIHIPYPLTWAHERTDPPDEATPRYARLASITEVPAAIAALQGPA